MSEWQPIETAPKDREILLFYPFNPGGFMFIGVFASTEADGHLTWRDPDDFEKLGDEPSHWMPLPAPPSR